MMTVDIISNRLLSVIEDDYERHSKFQENVWMKFENDIPKEYRNAVSKKGRDKSLQIIWEKPNTILVKKFRVV